MGVFPGLMNINYVMLPLHTIIASERASKTSRFPVDSPYWKVDFLQGKGQKIAMSRTSTTVITLGGFKSNWIPLFMKNANSAMSSLNPTLHEKSQMLSRFIKWCVLHLWQCNWGTFGDGISHDPLISTAAHLHTIAMGDGHQLVQHGTLLRAVQGHQPKALKDTKSADHLRSCNGWLSIWFYKVVIPQFGVDFSDREA